MRCDWQSYIRLLPVSMRQKVDRLGADTLQELRMRCGQVPELITQKGSIWLDKPVTADDLLFCINTASQYSPWSAVGAGSGYITAQGGHRIGLCGQAIINNNVMTGIRSPTSLCMRVARDFPDIAKNASAIKGSILIIGAPSSGKTTLLRDLIRKRSETENIAVVDERGELFPAVKGKFCFSTGKRTDILTGCRKAQGIDAVLRCMGPSCIAVDEITADEDCAALLHAGWCGVSILATAHARNKQELYARPVYKPLVESDLFDTVLILQPDKSWKAERMQI